MLKIVIPPFEIFDETNNTFIQNKTTTVLKMEYSLHAIALWEQEYEKPWIPKKDINPYNKEPPKDLQRTPEELQYFYKCMVLNIPIDEFNNDLFFGFTKQNYEDIGNYLQKTRSATKIIPDEGNKKGKSRPLTSEVVYAWMSELQIPWEAQYWNFNRLLNLVQIINEDNTPPNKKKKNRTKNAYNQMKEWSQINDQRLKQLGTKG